ncbi:glycosyltransferase family 2 protein [Fulvivirgaceae bacterium BMA10]|uniref:Glycosyltransferase family 2 protein n=1 Tax=Splendidivirga corallicola TaxID=3051826 RepID=A0ABT8KQS3_9BACT|nr:glycosyltransferase family 2 protein [Fulvivirgaceae bacterium BMA10]
MASTKTEMGLLKMLPTPPKNKTGYPWDQEMSVSAYNENEEWPKISIVTPSFNQGGYIEETIRSVLLQNYPNLEYIIIDGGSTDQTVEIIKKYEPWISYWVSEKDNGQTDAINKGLVKCSGEIFNWINSDDYYQKDCFKLLAENFKQEDVWVVSGFYRFFNDAGVTQDREIGPEEFDTLTEKICLSRNHQPSTFFRLDKLRQLGELNEKLNYVMDQDIWIRYLLRFGDEHIKNIHQVLTNFRIHPDSKTDQFYELFSLELYSIFFGIAKKLSLTQQAELLNQYKEGKIEEAMYDFDLSKEEGEEARKAINFQMLWNAKKLDSLNTNRELLGKFLKAVDKNSLNKKHKKLFDKLRFKYLVRPIHNILMGRN